MATVEIYLIGIETVAQIGRIEREVSGREPAVGCDCKNAIIEKLI